MNLGKIQVFVYTSRGKIPVPNSTVLFTQFKKQENTQEKDLVLAIEVTNTSGLTRTIQFPTPEEENSTSPTEQIPATLVDIWVEHQNFITQKIEGVQIFPDTETTLPVELIPLAEGESSLVEETTVDLPTQDL